MVPKPNPHPGIALFAFVIGFFGFMAWQLAREMPRIAVIARIVAVALLLLGAWLMVKFLYGLGLDRTVHRDGLLTQGRITGVEEMHGGKGRPDHWWMVHFEMTDAGGTVHRTYFHEDGDRRWKVGDAIDIRYHPAAPAAIFRIVS
jgi:hypothetical protein